MSLFSFLSKDPEYWLEHGRKQAKYSEKIKCYDKALRLNPKYFEAWVEKARCLLASKGNAEALEAYNTALNIEPKNVFITLEKANLLKKMGKQEDSLKVIDFALKIEPKNVFALFEKANLLKKMGKQEDSLKVIDYILSFEPENSIAQRAKTLAAIINKNVNRKISERNFCQECGIEIFHHNSCPICQKTLCWECLDPRFHDCIKDSIPTEGDRPRVSITYFSNGHIESRK